MTKRISRKVLVNSALAIRKSPLIGVGSEEYKNVRRLRRHGIKVYRFKGSRKYFLELNWRKKIEGVLADGVR